jgi:RimJ/RimL family protein N-acetyltransferase
MLELLEPTEYTLTEALFSAAKINVPILHCILENKIANKVLVDSKKKPLYALAHCPGSWTFLAGELNQVALHTVATYLKSLPKVSLACPLGWEYRHFFENERFAPVDRIQFRRSHDLHAIQLWKDRLASPDSVDEISEKNFDQCNWRLFVLNYWGDKHRFYFNGKGFCIVRQGKVLSESYGLIARDNVEIGVVTDENHRGQNLGTMICAFMLSHCYEHGLEPFWSCDAANAASASIAKKLGFKEDCRYLFLKYSSQ